jgi:hypothetical protein
MKNKLWLSFLAVLAVSLFTIGHIRATQFPPSTATDTINLGTNNPFMSVTTSNKTTAWFVESALNHTFQFITLTLTANSNVISGSLDGVSWTPIATNATSAAATNSFTLSQRWSYLRCVFTQGTAGSSTNTVTYLGGR